ncbi:hypothetical protein [Stenotrophomonas ginsengisoli]|uniref:hypothetical protein n=1 Tax=Stenotrophomonas ginsengisoli TaxID=336566 RepID=UPI00128F12B3|nr:hypothetical protein [Stenotrophomonas ginsengisoli]
MKASPDQEAEKQYAASIVRPAAFNRSPLPKSWQTQASDPPPIASEQLKESPPHSKAYITIHVTAAHLLTGPTLLISSNRPFGHADCAMTSCSDSAAKAATEININMRTTISSH